MKRVVFSRKTTLFYKIGGNFYMNKWCKLSKMVVKSDITL